MKKCLFCKKEFEWHPDTSNVCIECLTKIDSGNCEYFDDVMKVIKGREDEAYYLRNTLMDFVVYKAGIKRKLNKESK